MAIYYLSDNAYSHLCSMARISGYTFASNYGLSSFACELSNQKFADTRPRHVSKHDEQMLSVGKHPEWKPYDAVCYPRCLHLSPRATENYLQIAYTYDIANRFLTTNAIVASVLEAIGNKWLTPDTVPVRSKPLYKKKPQKETNWL